MSAVTPEAPPESFPAWTAEQYGGDFGTTTDPAALLEIMRELGQTGTGLEKWAIRFRFASAESYFAFARSEWEVCDHLMIGLVIREDGSADGLEIPDRRNGVSPLEKMIRFRDQAHTVTRESVADLLGCADPGPERSVAFMYDSREAFDMLAEANREAYGHTVRGPVKDVLGRLFGLIEYGDPPVVPPWDVDCKNADGTPAEPERGYWRCVESMYPIARIPATQDRDPRPEATGR